MSGLPAKSYVVRTLGALVIALVLASLCYAGFTPHAAYAANNTSQVSLKANEAEKGKNPAPQITWVQRGGNMYCKVNGVTQKGGIKQVGTKFYLFDKKGAQKTGWQKVGGSYYYFGLDLKTKGARIAGKVVNGVRLGKDGKAILNSSTLKEVQVLTESKQMVDKYTKATWSKSKKLKKCFNVLVHVYGERMWHRPYYGKGWARLHAHDLFLHKSGSCDSHGAAMAYVGVAVGYTDCKAVSSGGHTWSEINGKVYDSEWSKRPSITVYGVPMSRSGVGGMPAYRSNRVYIATLAPKSKEITGKAISSKFGGSIKDGLIEKDGALYYFKKNKMTKNKWVTIKKASYYFGANGKAAMGGASKIGGDYYVFKENGKLAKGSKKYVKIAGTTYRVTSAGKANPGWDGSMYFDQQGRLLKGDWFTNKNFYAADANGVYNSERTAALRTAFAKKDCTKLIQLLGKPKSAKYSTSCNVYYAADGSEITGDDGVLYYENFKIYTFRGKDGLERLVDVVPTK